MSNKFYYRHIFIALFLLSMLLTANGAFESFAIRGSEFLTLGPPNPSQISVTFSHNQRFGLPELAINSFSLIAPVNKYFAGLKLWSTGDEIYSEKKISTIFGFRIRKSLMRINVDLYQISIKDYGSEFTPGMGFEVNHNLVPWLEVSSGVDQLLIAQSNKIHVDIERKFWSYLECYLNDKTILALSLEKPFKYRSSLSLGLEQKLNNHVGFRLLVSDYPASRGLGLFFNYGDYRFTISANSVSPLGWSNGAGIRFTW